MGCRRGGCKSVAWTTLTDELGSGSEINIDTDVYTTAANTVRRIPWFQSSLVNSVG